MRQNIRKNFFPKCLESLKLEERFVFLIAAIRFELFKILNDLN
ncbi:hypothetical protein LEP1GSC038_0304 [Leptospira weilii str. 2006001855]|uniref:Uncharacterized protein n=1 Tax=Leptospira weilii str. 2006001855 TaxID=996804 RepID=M6FKG2_9LEPT|nr:hypothetical protein LEP1GSC038_0304 [Leptospira weilii str. 2006001855]